MTDWASIRKVVHLPGTRLTPDVVLARSLEKSAHMKSAMVIIRWHDDTLAFDWSSMSLSDLTFAAKLLDMLITDEINRQESLAPMGEIEPTNPTDAA